MIQKASEEYGKELSVSTKKNLERKLQTETHAVVGKAVGDFQIQQKILEKEREQRLAEATTREEIQAVNQHIDEQKKQAVETLQQTIKESVDTFIDPVVFNDSIKEFLAKKIELADYFDKKNQEDIFDCVPPQKTNQIFTPKWVVKDMVDCLEKENPGCFDDPDKTFADLYMKSGMYITEIVTRLYQREHMKSLYPDDTERLNHIFAKQVFGCAPTEIIYRICLSYILGFSDEIRIQKHNIKLCDTLKYAKDGTRQLLGY
ncbi:hypothetical protein [Blautia sp. 1033sp1_1033st1_G9_1033SCRN_220408]|uniref:hypothetical protein n=1 Tax=Blautia sp. 1033sp1_1033st1_G9_1033SCRN_220408 TaxID=3144490 RepID=UPI0034A45AA2